MSIDREKIVLWKKIKTVLNSENKNDLSNNHDLNKENEQKDGII